MKKKLVAIVAGTMLCAGLLAGCGQKENVPENTVTESSESEGQKETTAEPEESTEEKELTGTIDEIKDFMFVITDENDTVTVKYTGTISEVDPFEGEVLSVEKAK